MLSFIIPAHNEEAWVGRCLAAIHGAMDKVREPYEAIVVDDASTDATAEVARQHDAHVLQVEHRQISATRNAGAREARGQVFFFVDADTLLNAAVVQFALTSIHAGAVGGGCVPHFEGWLPIWWRLADPVLRVVVRLLRMPGGACQLCTRAAFETVGGFSENHYAAEDALFVLALKRLGRFVVPAEPVITSGSNLRAHSCLTVVRLLARFAFRGPDAFRDRARLDLWYRPRRES
jgi:glycosyltransferase involved in cell wall biosynthesis